jgi:hypothetical protein
MAVAVRLKGHEQYPGVETTFTENVSTRGARVLTMRRWKPNDKLEIDMLAGGFHAVARVAYCVPVNNSCFAIGLEFMQPLGQWVMNR